MCVLQPLDWMEDVAALQLAQPSLGKMAVKEPAQPFSAADSGLWQSLTTTDTLTGECEVLLRGSDIRKKEERKQTTGESFLVSL